MSLDGRLRRLSKQANIEKEKAAAAQ